jgi:hypothetical protein
MFARSGLGVIELRQQKVSLYPYPCFRMPENHVLPGRSIWVANLGYQEIVLSQKQKKDFQQMDSKGREVSHRNDHVPMSVHQSFGQILQLTTCH